MGFKGEARQGDVGLRLQVDRLDAVGGAALRHAAPVEEIGHEAGDEHRLARARQAGDAQPQGGFEEGARDGGHGAFDLAGDAVGDGRENHGAPHACPMLARSG